jgi:hypothetical protein
MLSLSSKFSNSRVAEVSHERGWSCVMFPVAPMALRHVTQQRPHPRASLGDSP